eukprot:s1831_g6.t1
MKRRTYLACLSENSTSQKKVPGIFTRVPWNISERSHVCFSLTAPGLVSWKTQGHRRVIEAAVPEVVVSVHLWVTCSAALAAVTPAALAVAALAVAL